MIGSVSKNSKKLEPYEYLQQTYFYDSIIIIFKKNTIMLGNLKMNKKLLQYLSLFIVASGFLIPLEGKSAEEEAPKTASSPPASLGKLPRGDLHRIISYLPPKDVVSLRVTSKEMECKKLPSGAIINVADNIWNNTDGSDLENYTMATSMFSNYCSKVPDEAESILKRYVNPRYRSVIILPYVIENIVLKKYPKLIELYKKLTIDDFKSMEMNSRERLFIQAYLSQFPLYVAEGAFESSPLDPAYRVNILNTLKGKVAPAGADRVLTAAVISVDEYLERPAVDRPRLVCLTRAQLRENKIRIGEKIAERLLGGTVGIDRTIGMLSLEGPSLKPLIDTFVIDLKEGFGSEGRVLNLRQEDIPFVMHSIIFICGDTDSDLIIGNNFLTRDHLPESITTNSASILDFSHLKKVKRIGNGFLSNRSILYLNLNLEELEEIGDNFMEITSFKKDYFVEFPSFSSLRSIGQKFFHRTGYHFIDFSRANALTKIGDDFCSSSKIKEVDLSGLTSIRSIGLGFLENTLTLDKVIFNSLDTSSLLEALGKNTLLGRPERGGWLASKPSIDIVFNLPLQKTGEKPTLLYFEPARAAWAEKLRPVADRVSITYSNKEYPFSLSESVMKYAWGGSVSLASSVYENSSILISAFLENAGKAHEALTAATFAMHGDDPDGEAGREAV